MTQTATLNEVSTNVPIADDRTVTIEPGQPWPSPYRGSRYSLVSDDDFDQAVLKWKHRDLLLFSEPPENLRRTLVLLGRKDGYGSFRVTAGGEVLTKIPAEDYKHVDQALVDTGWIPVYVGKLEGSIDFDEVTVDPRPPANGQVTVWRGLPFNHGERWSVTHDGTLVWKWRDYEFESRTDHPELVDTYRSYRGTPGRLYITENHHVWGNAPKDDIPAEKRSEVARAVAEWKQGAEANDETATLRLVNRRLVATSRSDDPATGQFPIHLGHLSEFDGGAIPKPVVDEESYYLAVCEYETVFE